MDRLCKTKFKQGTSIINQFSEYYPYNYEIFLLDSDLLLLKYIVSMRTKRIQHGYGKCDPHS